MLQRQKSIMSAGDIYFLFRQTGDTYIISPMLYKVREDEKLLELQLTRDIGWMFSLPVTGQIHKHLLLSYFSAEEKSTSTHHSYLSKLLEMEGLGKSVKIVDQVSFGRDHEALRHIIQNIDFYTDQLRSGHDFIKGISLHSDQITLTQDNLLINYMVDLYYDGSKINNIVCLPSIQLSRT
jgi:hypothetical protein